jgi:amino acid transporter
VTRWEIVALSLNDVIGSGVYLLPAAAAALGPASPLAVVVAGFAVLLVVLCFAEAARSFDGPGGAYLYARAAWGGFVAFEVGWLTVLTRVAALASLSVGFAQALAWALPSARGGWGRSAAIAVPIVLLTVVNLRGARAGARTASLLLLAKLLPLGLLLAAGLPAVRSEILLAPAPGSVRLGEVALLLLFAFAGFENTAAAAGEFREPRRDVPFALLSQIGFVTLLYVLVQVVAQGTLPTLASSTAPLADVAAVVLGGWGGAVLTLGALASILGSMASTVVSGPRYLLALAKDGFGPRLLAREHAENGAPVAAILVQSLVVLPLALTGSFTGLAALSVLSRLATYASTAAAVPALRRKSGGANTRGFLPGGILVPAGAVAVCLLLAASATSRDLAAGAGAVAAGAVLYPFRRSASSPTPSNQA